ncbi:TetR/AcrR family transcriptional regulator C-terminal domain-containing protein [Streptomyces sp. NPDC006172]|uniref:TetR/AcrR family transcriptional regulator C-terminal domain-containing protein n=1 Tax=Streptomyces sp. NPDC006172 TaxID=3154470 RepID=UPI0033CC325D
MPSRPGFPVVPRGETGDYGLGGPGLMEAHAEAATGHSEDQWMDSRTPALRALVESGRFPNFTKVVGAYEDGFDLRLDALFEFGLKALLGGLTSIVEGQEAVT